MAMLQTKTQPPTFLNSLHHAAYLNSKGAAALCHPDPRGATIALGTLRQSLRILQQLSPSRHGPQQASPVLYPPMMNSGRVPLQLDGSFYVYDQVKLFSPPIGDVFLAQTQLPVFSSIVLFNTALAYHRLAVDTKCAKYSDAALRLYQSCGQLCMLHGGNNEDMIFLYIAVMNNVMLIQNGQVRLAELHATITTLRSVMKFISSRNQIMSLSHQDAVNEFQLNLMSVNALSPASAA